MRILVLGTGGVGSAFAAIAVRRTFFERPGQLYGTPEALIVYLDPFRGQEALIPLIDVVNAQRCRLPWLENRRLVISPTPGRQHGGP